MTTQDAKKLQDKFFSDPDWALMEELLHEYIDPLRSCMDIQPDWSSDQIATEVRGRQIAYQALDKFLSDAGVMKPRIINHANNFN